MDWKKRLTAEKSLFQVYWKARRVASSRWNTSFSWIVFFLLTAGLSANAIYGKPTVSLMALVSGIREVSEIGFTFTTAILGFLIAGFAIFSSITKPEVFVLLAKLDHPKFGISQLQFMFFNFLLVFIPLYCLFVHLNLREIVSVPEWSAYGYYTVPDVPKTNIRNLCRYFCFRRSY